MTSRDYVFLVLTLCLGYILQFMPLASYVQWFVPEWVLMIFIFWQLQSPGSINFWWVWPMGLLMDVQQSTYLGTHVLSLAVILFALQLMSQRLRLYNVAQQAGVIFLLVCAFQMMGYWAIAAVDEYTQPLYLWTPALVSMVVLPWRQLVLGSAKSKLH